MPRLDPLRARVTTRVGVMLVAALASACGAAPGSARSESTDTVDIPTPASTETHAEAPPPKPPSSPPDLFGLRSARIENARVSTQTVQMAVELWQASHPGQCPSVEDLLKDHMLVELHMKDPWGSLFAIECTTEGNRVISLGPDEKRGTDDDIESPPLP